MTIRHPRASIDLGVLFLRRFAADDAASLSAAVEETIDDLRPWMPWAVFEPATSAQRTALLQRWDRSWTDGVEFNYGMFEKDELVGACALHSNAGKNGLAIGYWVRTGRTRQGFATLAARGLTTAAFEIEGIEQVEIHHDKANLKSAAIPAKLGYKMVMESAHSIDAPGQTGTSCLWRISRREWLQDGGTGITVS